MLAPATNIWSTTTPDQIGPESQWKYPEIHETARNRMRMKKTYLCIWIFWEKSIFVHLPYWNCRKIRSKCEKTHTASSLADPLRFLRFAERRNTRKQDPFEKRRFGPFRGRTFGASEPHSGVTEVLNSLKYSGNRTEVIDTLGRLLA